MSLEILFGESRNASFADGIQHVTLRYVSLPSVDDDSVKRVIYFFNALVEILVSVPFSPLRRSRRGAEQRLLGSPVSLRLRPLVFARRRLGGGQLFPTRREFLVDVDVIVVHSRALVRVRIGERSIMGVHHRHRPERAGAHGDARDEQLRERKRSRSSSIALVGGTAFDGIVGRHDARTSAWTSGASVRGCPRWIFRYFDRRPIITRPRLDSSSVARALTRARGVGSDS